MHIKINNQDYDFEEMTILEACQKAGIKVPTLCYLKDINEIGACRICVVEIKGKKNLVASCITKIWENMEIFTHTKKVLDSRKTTLELIMSNHKKECPSCIRNNNCELQKLCRDYNIEENKYEGEKINYEIDHSSSSIVRDQNKCILCNRCVSVCNSIQKIKVIGKNNRGFETNVSCAFETLLVDTACINCGQCIKSCPTGALTEKSDIDEVIKALNNEELQVVVGTAPAVRVALGEEFGLPIGTNVKGKMVSALRKIGFNKVFDVNYTADLTIIEEGTEFIHRYQNGENLPLITSCSPGWIKYMEHVYPDLIPNVSTCKSPQEMFGAIIKSYYAEKLNIDSKKLFVVTIMPCTAKKFERQRHEDVDAVLTTRELGRLINLYGIDFKNLQEEEFDNPFGTGACTIFGNTGGVMESALRTVSEVLDKTSTKIEYKEVRGLDNIKEATYNISGNEIKVAVVNGIGNAKKVLDEIRAKKSPYHFIEIMTCPGGCINGGGQPIIDRNSITEKDALKLRKNALYDDDKQLVYRKAHDNPYIKKLYKEYLGKPNGEKAHELLHTNYKKRKKY